MRVVLKVVAVVVLVGVAGAGWLLSRPATSKLCTVAGSIDEVGGPTPEAARERWAAEVDLEVDVERPDDVSGSGDRVTATYETARPEYAVADGDRSYFREVVTERRAEGDWRVVSANQCSSWRE